MLRIIKTRRPKGSPKLEGKSNRFICVLIADDHPYLISGVEEDLNKDRKIKIVGTAGSYAELLEKTKELKPHIILLDLKMPGSEVVNLKEYIEKLKFFAPCRIIVFTNETGWARVHNCLEFGASAYVEKAISIGKLSEIIRNVHEKNDTVIFTSEEIPEIDFSERQSEVLHYIADGMENKEISKKLMIENKTVQSYVDDIKHKFSEAFSIYPVKPRTLMILASKLGYGHTIA